MDTLSPEEAGNIRLRRRGGAEAMPPDEAANLRLRRRGGAEAVSPEEAANIRLKRRGTEAMSPEEAANLRVSRRGVDSEYGKPTSDQLAQYERSYYLNTGKAAPGTTLTVEQLRIKYGPPHTGGNSPPNAPTAAN